MVFAEPATRAAAAASATKRRPDARASRAPTCADREGMPRATPRPRLCHPEDDARLARQLRTRRYSYPNLKNTETRFYQKTPPTPTRDSDSRLSSLPVSSQLRYRYLRRLAPLPPLSRVYPRTPTGRRHPSSLSFPRCDLARLGLFPQSGFGASNRRVAPCTTTMANAIKTAYDTANATLQ